MRQRLLRKSCHKIVSIIFCLFILLFLFPLLSFAQEDSLQVTFNLTSIHHSTQFRDSSAAFPSPVLSLISVLDSENQYVHGLADREKWVGASDVTESGAIVDSIWSIILEYHEEDNNIPENPDVKSKIPPYLVTEVTDSGTLLSVALAMDYSWSMYDVVHTAKNAAIDFIKRLYDNDRAAIIKFYSDVYVYQDFTSDKDLLEEAIRRFPPDMWGTPLYRAIKRSVFECSDEPGKRAVIVYTDGWDNIGDVTVNEIIDDAKKDSVSIYTIGLGPYLQEEELIRIARETGGYYTHINDAEKLCRWS